jgi:capsular polysaccharide export protein
LPGNRSRDEGWIAPARPLHVFTLGLWRPGRVRRILSLAGWEPRAGLPGASGAVGVWGARPSARRGAWVAMQRGARLIRIEEAFLRGLTPGRVGGAPLGLLIDPLGVHYDPTRPSALEERLAHAPLDDPAHLARAAAARARWQRLGFGKFAAADPALPMPEPGFVLVVDQTLGDASVTVCGAGRAHFRAMLAAARAEHPGARIVIRRHPETAAGRRPGHFTDADLDRQTVFLDAPVSPWRLIEGARAIYTLSSQLGFEAICAGRRPVVFGGPFYAGWGLSDDRMALPRRDRRLDPDQLFAAAMLDYPVWYDPFRDRLCAIERVLDIMAALARAWREDRHGHVAIGMRAWKKPHLRRFFGNSGGRVRFRRDPVRAAALARRSGAGLLVWGTADTGGLTDDDPPARRVEDGFLRSRGLGAALAPPVSLVADDLGLYYDATRPSRLEALIDAARDLPEDALARAAQLRRQLISERVTKYNLGGGSAPPDTGGRPAILVVGQVADDASIQLGCAGLATNGELLAAARTANPGGFLMYKPHPDVEAGLRPGALSSYEAAAADHIARGADPLALVGVAAEVWTLTSLLGFEALLRGVPVTCLGAPFYAGWGLTRDLGPVPTRRRRPGVPLDGLIHAALIAYPRYRDPVSGLPCPVEVAVDRLARGRAVSLGPRAWLLSRAKAARARSGRPRR